MQAAELKDLIFIPHFHGKTSQQRIEQVTFDIMQTTNQPTPSPRAGYHPRYTPTHRIFSETRKK